MKSNTIQTNPVIDALLGVAIGDALGVPFEFKVNMEMKTNPATGMVSYGTHHQPEGTWSDDTSLTLCLAESLVGGYDLKDMAEQFIQWKNKAHWTARGNVFDIGMTTSRAISRLANLIEKNEIDQLSEQKYYARESDNGNGSLMRILPLLFFIKGLPIEQQFKIIWETSALTHRHIRAAMSCLIYLKLAEKIIAGVDKHLAYQETRENITVFWNDMEFSKTERKHFERMIQNDISELDIEALRSGGYVIESIEASLWCFLNRDTYKDGVLTAINLGNDTDTTGAITGGLCGLYYGLNSIPEYWIVSIARLEDIIALGNQLYQKYSESI